MEINGLLEMPDIRSYKIVRTFISAHNNYNAKKYNRLVQSYSN